MIDSLYIHGYFIVKNFFDKQQTNYFISQVFESIKKKETHLSSSDENEVVHPKTWNVNAHPIWENTLYSILGNVEELVDEKLNPLEDKAIYLKNRMKDLGFLMSNDGINHNVIKIKPPMIFNKKNADNLLFFLDLVLKEDYIKYG